MAPTIPLLVTVWRFLGQTPLQPYGLADALPFDAIPLSFSHSCILGGVPPVTDLGGYGAALVFCFPASAWERVLCKEEYSAVDIMSAVSLGSIEGGLGSIEGVCPKVI